MVYLAEAMVVIVASSGSVMERDPDACAFSESAMIDSSVRYMTERHRWNERQFDVRISKIDKASVTVVASKLPVSPDAAILLVLDCDAVVVREMSFGPAHRD